MYEFEDYDRCLRGVPPDQKRTYCYLRSQIKPNASSDLWKVIEVNICYWIVGSVKNRENCERNYFEGLLSSKYADVSLWALGEDRKSFIRNSST